MEAVAKLRRGKPRRRRHPHTVERARAARAQPRADDHRLTVTDDRGKPVTRARVRRKRTFLGKIAGKLHAPRRNRHRLRLLRRAIRNVYGLDQMPTEPEVLQIAERWRPYRSLAVGYLFASEFET